MGELTAVLLTKSGTELCGSAAWKVDWVEVTGPNGTTKFITTTTNDIVQANIGLRIPKSSPHQSDPVEKVQYNFRIKIGASIFIKKLFFDFLSKISFFLSKIGFFCQKLDFFY